MTRTRLLSDPDDIAASDEFKRLLRASSKTQDQVGAEIGQLSQGTVWQWANRRLAIPAEHARKAAAAVGGDPNAISVAWRNLNLVSQVSEPNALSPLVSQAQRLDPSMIRDAMMVLRKVYARVGLKYDIESEPEQFRDVYEALQAEGGMTTAENVIDISDMIADRIKQRTEKAADGQQLKGGKASSDDRGPAKRRAKGGA